MAIVNMTPDSFSGDGCLAAGGDAVRKAVGRVRRFIQEGADIIDVGGESSRPGARRISAREEINRVVPLIRELSRRVKIPVSVDTYKPLVARHALDAGATIVNNIMGAKPDPGFLRMVCRYNAAVVLMHMRGTPRTMQKNIRYRDVVREITAALKKSIEKCLEIGIKSDKIIIDPGIGFGKTVEHNLEIIRRLRCFEALKCPVLIGTSRKSFIGKLLHVDQTRRLEGSLATVAASILNGAHIVRVHDVRPTKQVAVMTDAIMNGR
ncbi:MAG: dihydropteroate synthase [Candidatus Omnitrophica bacterium]|nr:dihydropteroate synthase [Candidatus Omnitrophota bacterium]